MCIPCLIAGGWYFSYPCVYTVHSPNRLSTEVWVKQILLRSPKTQLSSLPKASFLLRPSQWELSLCQHRQQQAALSASFEVTREVSFQLSGAENVLSETGPAAGTCSSTVRGYLSLCEVFCQLLLLQFDLSINIWCVGSCVLCETNTWRQREGLQCSYETRRALGLQPTSKVVLCGVVLCPPVYLQHLCALPALLGTRTPLLPARRITDTSPHRLSQGSVWSVSDAAQPRGAV